MNTEKGDYGQNPKRWSYEHILRSWGLERDRVWEEDTEKCASVVTSLEGKRESHDVCFPSQRSL